MFRRARAWVAFALLLLAGGPDLAGSGQPGKGKADEQRSLRYQVFARSPRVNHEIMGPVERWVQGVPAEPVDSFNWDGKGSVPVQGELSLVADPVENTGLVSAHWTDQYGDWELLVTVFLHPHHGAGVRLGPSVNDRKTFIKDAITTNGYLHGDTGSGQPVLPTLFSYLAAWGPALVTLNGVPFVNPFELPSPLWEAHLMVTEGVREADGTVRTVDGGIYSPMKMTQGRVDPNDIEVHLVFHDAWYPETTNIPPLFSFFYHLVFENVVIQITQLETPMTLEVP